MRTGRRCTTFTQLPVAFCAGIRAKAAPVRVRLDQAELRDHPLRVGLTMDAVIDTRP